MKHLSGADAGALDRRMNLAPLDVEQAHVCAGARRLIYVSDKRDRANSVPRVREQFERRQPNFVEELIWYCTIRAPRLTYLRLLASSPSV